MLFPLSHLYPFSISSKKLKIYDKSYSSFFLLVKTRQFLVLTRLLAKLLMLRILVNYDGKKFYNRHWHNIFPNLIHPDHSFLFKKSLGWIETLIIMLFTLSHLYSFSISSKMLKIYDKNNSSFFLLVKTCRFLVSTRLWAKLLMSNLSLLGRMKSSKRQWAIWNRKWRSDKQPIDAQGL